MKPPTQSGSSPEHLLIRDVAHWDCAQLRYPSSALLYRTSLHTVLLHVRVKPRDGESLRSVIAPFGAETEQLVVVLLLYILLRVLCVQSSIIEDSSEERDLAMFAVSVDHFVIRRISLRVFCAPIAFAR